MHDIFLGEQTFTGTYIFRYTHRLQVIELGMILIHPANDHDNSPRNSSNCITYLILLSTIIITPITLSNIIKEPMIDNVIVSSVLSVSSVVVSIATVNSNIMHRIKVLCINNYLFYLLWSHRQVYHQLLPK